MTAFNICEVANDRWVEMCTKFQHTHMDTAHKHLTHCKVQSFNKIKKKVININIKMKFSEMQNITANWFYLAKKAGRGYQKGTKLIE